MLPFIGLAEARARTQMLKKIIEEMLGLIGDASNFVLEYKSDGVAGTGLIPFITSI